MKQLIIASLAAAATLFAQAGPAEGLMEQSRRFALTGNYTAALDQLRYIDRTTLTPAEAEDFDFCRAACLYGCGDYRNALEAYRAYAHNYAGSLRNGEALKGVADCLLALGERDKAIEAYRAIPAGSLAPAQAAEAALSLGAAALAANDPATAREAFTEATSYKGTASDANFYLGVMSFDQGDYKAARAHFAKVNTAAGAGRLTDFYLTSTDFAEGNFSKALASAKRLLGRKDLGAERIAELNRIAGESLYNEGERGEAIPYLEKYIKGKGDAEPMMSTLYILGVNDFENGNYASALDRLNAVTEHGTGALRQSAYLFAGQSLLATGDTSAAILAFDKAAKSNDDPDVREAAFYNYAAAKFAGAQVPFASTAEVFEKFLKLYPNGPYSDRVSAYLATGYMADSDYERALARLESISEPTPAISDARKRVLLALALQSTESGDYTRASDYIARAEALAGRNSELDAETTLARASLLYKTGRYADAAAKYRTYLRTAPKGAENRPAALYGLAYALYNTPDAAGAEKAFVQAEPAMESAAAKADVLNRLGDIAFARADFSSAAERYASAFSQSPSTGDYALLAGARMKGYLRDYQGKLDALDLFRRSFASSVLMPDALLETTQAQISLGRNADAVATYRTIIADYPRTAQGRNAYLQLAMTLLDMHRTDEAIEAYRSVISLYPTSSEAAQASALLKNLYTEDGNAAEYLAFMNSVDNAPQIDPAEAEQLEFESAVKAFRSRGESRQLEAFATAHPSSAHAPEALGILLDNAVDINDAPLTESLAERILARYPDSNAAEHALLAKAKGAAAGADLPSALELYRSLADKASDATTATEARLGLMRTARDMGKHDIAGAAADAILASSASSAAISEARFTKATALAAAGDNDRATEIWLEMAETPSDIFGAKSAFEAADALHDAGNDKKALEVAQKFVKSGSQHRRARTSRPANTSKP